MTSFLDFEIEIKSFKDRLSTDKINLYIEYLKTLNLDFLKNRDVVFFIYDLVVNSTLIQTSRDIKKNNIPESAIVCKYKNLFLIDKVFLN